LKSKTIFECWQKTIILVIDHKVFDHKNKHWRRILL